MVSIGFQTPYGRKVGSDAQNTANSGDSQPCTQTNRSFGLQWSLKVLHVRYVNELWNMIHMSHPQEQWAPQAAV